MSVIFRLWRHCTYSKYKKRSHFRYRGEDRDDRPDDHHDEENHDSDSSIGNHNDSRNYIVDDIGHYNAQENSTTR